MALTRVFILPHKIVVLNYGVYVDKKTKKAYFVVYKLYIDKKTLKTKHRVERYELKACKD